MNGCFVLAIGCFIIASSRYHRGEEDWSTSWIVLAVFASVLGEVIK